MAVSPAMAAEQLPVVRFMAAGHAFAVEARQVAGMRDGPDQQAMWIEDVLGLVDSEYPIPVRRWLSIHHATGLWSIGVGEPVVLDSIAVADIHPVPKLVAGNRCVRGLAALALEGDATHQSLTLLVDLGAVLPEQENTHNED